MFGTRIGTGYQASSPEMYDKLYRMQSKIEINKSIVLGHTLAIEYLPRVTTKLRVNLE